MKMRVSLSFGLVTMFLLVQTAITADEIAIPNPEFRVLDGVYWTDTAPVIDGKPGDACWQDAAVANDFRILNTSGRMASEKTEVRICYDATHLYLFWKAFESQMDKLDSGPPLDRHDFISEREFVQVMLDPHLLRKGEHFTFSASPLGAHQDSGGKKGLQFECNWQVAGGRIADGWIMEMAIPFAELSSDTLPFYATPQPGEAWGINFNRLESARGEQSQWTLTGSVFGNYGCLGKVTFKGRRNQESQPKVEFLTTEPLFFGPGEAKLKIASATAPVDAAFTLSKNGKPVKEGKGKVTREWQVPYTITVGGQWQLQATLSIDGKPFYVVRGEADLPAVAETITEVRQAVAAIQTKLTTLNHPAAERLRRSFAELNEDLKASDQYSGRTEQLTRQQWREFTKATETLRSKWKALSLDANLICLYRKGQGFAVGTALPNEKVYPDTIYNGPLEGSIEVSAAGNEYESMQLVVLPFWRDLHSLSVAFTDLRGPNGVISASNLSWSRVMYVSMPKDNPSMAFAHAREPDILWPGEPFIASAGVVQPLWIDVYMPKGTPAGVYKGTVIVKSEGFEVTCPLYIRAYGFDLPDSNTLRGNHWFYWTNWGYTFYNFYNNKVPYSPAIWERHARLLARYRVQQHYIHEPAMPTPACLEPDGHFTFDFSGYDEYIRIGKKYHANTLWLTLDGSPSFANPAAPVIERKTGKRLKMESFVKDAMKRREGKQDWWHDNPVYADYVREVVAYLRRMNVLDQTVCELYDEAFDDVWRWRSMINHVPFVKSLTPDLNMIALGVNPTQSLDSKSAIGVLDTWGPHLFQCDNSTILATIQERQKKNGEQFWFYTCTSQQGPGGYSPFHFHHASYLQPRIHSWMAWRLGCNGFMTYFLADAGDWQKNIKANPAERWPAAEWYADPGGPGHNLVYPGPEPSCELIPSMRLASLRDGIEDYEYFVLLCKKATDLDPKQDGKLLAAIQHELQIEQEIIRSVYSYTDDARLLTDKRDKLAALIDAAGNGRE